MRHAWERLFPANTAVIARAWHRCEIRAEYELLPGPVGRDKRLKDQPEVFMLHLVFLSTNKCSPCPLPPAEKEPPTVAVS